MKNPFVQSICLASSRHRDGNVGMPHLPENKTLHLHCLLCLGKQTVAASSSKRASHSSVKKERFN